jgi:hypothetical protein
VVDVGAPTGAFPVNHTRYWQSFGQVVLALPIWLEAKWHPFLLFPEQLLTSVVDSRHAAARPTFTQQNHGGEIRRLG